MSEGYLDIDRKFITSTLATDYSPKSALYLLLKSNLILEAVLFSDFFNDYRSRLLLRFYTDSLLGTQVFRSGCIDLIDNLLNSVNDAQIYFQKPQDVISAINSHLDSIIQLNVIFDIELIKELECTVIKRVEFLFAALSTRVPIHVPLPRPPIYALPAQFSENSDDEILIWNNLYFLTHLYISLLQKTNQLDLVIQHVVNIIENCKKGNQYYQQDEETKIPEEVLNVFLSFVLMILRMNYRDTLTVAEREEWVSILLTIPD